MAKKPISARIDKEILAKAKKVAKKDYRSFNNFLETALRKYIENK